MKTGMIRRGNGEGRGGSWRVGKLDDGYRNGKRRKEEDRGGWSGTEEGKE